MKLLQKPYNREKSEFLVFKSDHKKLELVPPIKMNEELLHLDCKRVNVPI